MRRIGTLALTSAALVALLAPQVAWSQGKPRYTRDTKVNVQVEQTERTKKPEEKAKKAEKAQPELTADDFIVLQGQVKHIRNQQVQLLEQLIQDTPNTEPVEKADLLFRLAELHAQSNRYWRFRAMEMYPKIDSSKKSARGSLKSKQNKYFAASKNSLLEAVKVYKRIAEDDSFKNYPRMDEALFYYAYMLQQAKYMKEARKVYHRLIKDHPNSKYIPDAYLAFADYYFANNSLANAEQFYDKVLQFPKAKVYNYALYKKGWVYLNLDRAQEALETFYKVAQRTKGNKKQATLNRAAKKDFVRAYAEVGKAQTAYKAFQRVDPGYAFEMLQILGDIYLGQGQAPKAIFTFREMIGIEPKNKRVCEWQYNVVQAMLSAGDNNQKADEIDNLVKLYSAYKDKNVLPAGALQECRENAAGMTSEMAKVWHQEANKTLNFENLGHVEKLYNSYIVHFPDAKDYGEMQYYFAELMWMRAENEKNQRLATEMWETAAAAFTDVVKTGKVNDKLLKESAYAAVLGWKNALAVDPRTNAPPIGEQTYDKIPEPEPIPERQKKMLDAFDIYITYVKDQKDSDLVEMKFLKARMFWRYNHLEEAIPVFEDIIENHLQHETAEFSANLLLDSLNRLQKFDQMVVWVDKLLKKTDFLEDREELKERLAVLKVQSMRKNAENLEARAKESGDLALYVDCGSAYLDILKFVPEAEDADEILFNAGVCFKEGKSMGAAIKMFQLLSERFPKSEQTKRAIGHLGNIYGRVAYYDKAAAKLEEYAKRFGGEKDAYEALSEAVFYRKGIGDDKQAIDDAEFFIKQYKRSKPAEAANAMFSMTSIYEKQDNASKTIDHLERYLKEFGARGGIDRQIIAHAKLGMLHWQESCPVKGVMGACVKVQRERATVNRRKKSRGSSLPSQCGPESKIKLTVVKRDDRKVREAQSEFQKAIRLFAGGKAVERISGENEAEKAARTAAMIKYLAAAKFHLAEEVYEDFLRIEFPTRLDFDPRNESAKKRSEKRFKEWLESKSKKGENANKQYQEVRAITGGGAHYAIASAARIGQIQQNFSDALFTATIPQDVRSGQYAEDKVDAYCDELTTAAEPLEETSIKAYGFCLNVSTQLSWFNEWSRLCEKELGQIRPQDFPTAAELRGEPTNVAAVIDTEPPIIRLGEE